MSFQIAVLKVLAAHPEGRASLPDLKKYLAVLASSGPDWSTRVKMLAERAPGLDIFSAGYVLRDGRGWSITDAGRQLLASIEAPADQPFEASKPFPPPTPVELPTNVIPLAEHRRRRAAA